MKKQIAVHVQNDYPNSYCWKWIEYINSTEDFSALPVNLKAHDALEQVRNCHGIMWHFRHTPEDKQIASRVLTAAEMNLKLPVWPNYNTRWIFDEKVSEHFLFIASDIEHVKSWVFWNYDEAKEFLLSTDEYPLVFKLSVGAGSANVIKLNNYEEALVYLERMFNSGIFPYTENEFRDNSMEGDFNYPCFKKRIVYGADYVLNKKIPPLPWYYQLQKNYVYFQKFIPDNEHDIRITVIGNRAFGFLRENREGDFRASGSGKIIYEPERVPEKAINIAFELSDKNSFQCMAYDFLMNGDNPQINEIGYGFNSKAIFDCSGYWDRNLNWHEGHMWPQDAQAEDFLDLIRGINC